MLPWGLHLPAHTGTYWTSEESEQNREAAEDRSIRALDYRAGRQHRKVQ